VKIYYVLVSMSFDCGSELVGLVDLVDLPVMVTAVEDMKVFFGGHIMGHSTMRQE
jgi:hypothetical protein